VLTATAHRARHFNGRTLDLYPAREGLPFENPEQFRRKGLEAAVNILPRVHEKTTDRVSNGFVARHHVIMPQRPRPVQR